MSIKDRGFASMTRDAHKLIASKGGLAAHAKGTAHIWTAEQAREAGRKGGRARQRVRAEQLAAKAAAAPIATPVDRDRVTLD